MHKKEVRFTLIMLAALAAASLPGIFTNGQYFGTSETATVHAATATATPTSKVTATPTVKATATPTSRATATPTSSVTATPTPVPEATVTYVMAYYNGSSVIVGESYDLADLKVYAYMSDGTLETITEFDVSDTVVTATGQNKFAVMYQGLTDIFYVQGKVLNSISAECEKFYVGYGNGLDSRDIVLTAYYSDTTSEVIEDYTISPTVFTTTGLQTVTVTYRGKTDKLQVFVNDKKDIKALNVTYSGPDLVVDQAVDRSDITVTAMYNDASLSTERITTYNILQDTFTKVGTNSLKVEFMGKSVECNITVIAKTVVAFRAEYTGDEVPIGTRFSKDDIQAYITYNDGNEVATTDFNIYNSYIQYLGDNTIKVYYGDFTASVIITGCEMGEPDFDYVSEYSVKSGNTTITIATAIPKLLSTDATTGALVKQSKLGRLYRRLGTDTTDYLGFTYEFADGDDEEYLPVTIRITLPDDYASEYTELYYSPNLKTILAKMNKEDVDEHIIEVTIYKTGTYMLVHDPSAYNVRTEDEEEEDEE